MDTRLATQKVCEGLRVKVGLSVITDNVFAEERLVKVAHLLWRIEVDSAAGSDVDSIYQKCEIKVCY